MRISAMRTYFFIFLINLTVYVPQTHAISATDFKQSMIEHRNRVDHEMLIAYRQFKSDFTNLDESLITEYAKTYHDLPKIMTLQNLESWGYPFNEDIATRLALFWGRKKQDLNENDRAFFEQTVIELNRIESAIKEDLFFMRLKKFYANSAAIKEELQNLEHWIDVFDTATFRRDEINIPNSQLNDAATYLNRENAPELAIKIVKYMTKVKSKFNKPFKALNRIDRIAICRQALF